jgi:hypothetical protein
MSAKSAVSAIIVILILIVILKIANHPRSTAPQALRDKGGFPTPVSLKYLEFPNKSTLFSLVSHFHPYTP